MEKDKHFYVKGENNGQPDANIDWMNIGRL